MSHEEMLNGIEWNGKQHMIGTTGDAASRNENGAIAFARHRLYSAQDRGQSQELHLQ